MILLGGIVVVCTVVAWALMKLEQKFEDYERFADDEDGFYLLEAEQDQFH